jgi:hypothetical protein
MKRICPSGLLLAVLLGVSGCGSETIDVQRAARPAAIGPDAPFTVLLTDAQQRDPEFIRTARIVVARLQAHGLVPAAQLSQARYAVMLDQHGTGPIVYDDTPLHANDSFGARGDLGGPGGAGAGLGGIGGPGLGGAGPGGAGPGGAGIGGPGGGRGETFADTGSDQHDRVARVDSGTTSFRIAIFDLTKPQRPDEKVFDAEAWAKAPHDGSDQVVSAMIDAALKDFPGKPQEDYSVPVPQKKKAGQSS